MASADSKYLKTLCVLIKDTLDSLSVSWKNLDEKSEATYKIWKDENGVQLYHIITDCLTSIDKAIRYLQFTEKYLGSLITIVEEYENISFTISHGNNSIPTEESYPHTFKDFLNPINYDESGHYTGDYTSPSYGSEKAIYDFEKWQDYGGINNKNCIDYRENGGALSATISANDIFDILDEDSPDFWVGKWSDMNSYIEMARHIPLVRKHLESGMSIEEIVNMQGTIGACAQYYFQNRITVIKAGEAYIHCNDGRHRTVAAQLVHVEIPVSIVQEYFFD